MALQADAPVRVTMISATLTDGAEGLSLIIDRIRAIAQHLKEAADQVYGECTEGADIADDVPAAGSAGFLAAQMRALDRCVVQAEGEAGRLCGAS